MIDVTVRGSTARLLDLDVECKPGHWIGGDYVSKIVTAIALGWINEDKVVEFDHYDRSLTWMLERLRSYYDAADIIVTHYGRGFDFPLLNGMCEREGLKPLERKLTIDTKLDRLKTHGRSQSQKNLAADYGLINPKVDVTLREWEGFNSREEGYRDVVVERVIGDVKQNIELFKALRQRGMLGPPRMMSYQPSGARRYSP